MNAFAKGFTPTSSRTPTPSAAYSSAEPIYSPSEILTWWRRGRIMLILGCVLITSHLWIVALQPVWADGVLYPVIGLAVLMCGWVFYLHGRESSGTSRLRWYLFALSLTVGGANYLRAGIGVFYGDSFNTLDAVLQAIAGTLTILAFTIPSVSHSLTERAVDITVALSFCALRIVYLHELILPSVGIFTILTHFAFESGFVLLICLIAFAASSKPDLAFFKSALIMRIGTLVAGLCTNQIGFLWLHEQTASPWSISATAIRVACALYLLRGLTDPAPLQVSPSQQVMLRSIVPFSMSCLTVWLATALLTGHRRWGYFGIAVGVGGFLLRTALSAYLRQRAETVHHLDTAPSNTIALDPLNSIENRAGFQRALANATPFVSQQTPLSLVLLGIENTAEPMDTPSPAKDDDQLIAIGRSLSQWSVAGGSLCYMGNARFAMLLPATSYSVATALAEHICIALETHRFAGKEGPVAVSSGIAEASRPAQASELLSIATNALIRSQIREDSRRRPVPLTGGIPADC